MPISDILVNVKRLRYYPVMESGPFCCMDNKQERSRLWFMSTSKVNIYRKAWAIVYYIQRAVQSLMTIINQ